jgi:hypothetical protein
MRKPCLQLQCRAEIYEINRLIKEKASANFSVLTEAVFPSSNSVRALTKTEWGIRWIDVTKDVGLIGIKSSTINEYSNHPLKYFYGKMMEYWDEKKTFYRQIKEGHLVIIKKFMLNVDLSFGKNPSDAT